VKHSGLIVVIGVGAAAAMFMSANAGPLTPPAGPIRPTGPSINDVFRAVRGEEPRIGRSLGPNFTGSTEGVRLVAGESSGVLHALIVTNYASQFRELGNDPGEVLRTKSLVRGPTFDESILAGHGRVTALSGGVALVSVSAGAHVSGSGTDRPGSTRYDLNIAFTEGLELQIEPGAMATAIYTVDR